MVFSGSIILRCDDYDKDMGKGSSTINNAYSQIRDILESARNRVYHNINFEMVLAYWNIGRVIVEEEQKGKERAGYGRYLIDELSERLTAEYGKGFDERNLRYIRDFYKKFKIRNALRSELSWTHYRSLLSICNKDARSFYLIECAENRWSTRELDRQVDSKFYERLCLSRDKKGVGMLAKKGQIIKEPKDLIKDPYVLEFVGLKEDKSFLEKDFEKKLIDKMYSFLLELGKGFSFAERQKRITADGKHYYIDLVFYNYLLKCFVLVDLKVGRLTPQDIGQMDFYVRYFENEIKVENDNPTIGIIICGDKDRTVVRYSLLEGSKRIFAAKYRFVIPSEKELKKGLR